MMAARRLGFTGPFLLHIMSRKKKKIEIKLNKEDEPKLRTSFHRPTKTWKQKLRSMSIDDLDDLLDYDRYNEEDTS